MEANRALRDLLQVVRDNTLETHTLLRRSTDELAAKLDRGRFREEPETEALLRAVLGTSYLEVLAPSQAEHHLTAASPTARRAFGDDHAEVGNIHYHLGRCANALNDYPSAACPTSGKPCTSHRKTGGDAHAMVSKTLWRLADVTESGLRDVPAAALPAGEPAGPARVPHQGVDGDPRGRAAVLQPWLRPILPGAISRGTSGFCQGG